MDSLLSPKEKAQKYWMGFLAKTWIECENKFNWVTFRLIGKTLTGTGTKVYNGRTYEFTIEYSPFNLMRFDRIYVKTKGLIQTFDTHFNADGSLCLYHPIKDLHGRPYIELVDIIPWISEWLYCYDKYLEFKVWVLPEHPHKIS